VRILHLSSEKNWRGGERQISFLMNGLSSFDDVEQFVAVKKDSEFAAYCESEGLKSTSFSFRNSIDIFTAYQLYKYCKNNKIDIIHAHTAKGHSLAVLAHRLGLKAKIVIAKRTIFPIKSIGKYEYVGVEKIICISKSIRDLLRESINRDDSVYELIYSSVALEDYEQISKSDYLHQKYDLPNDAFIIGNTSALTLEKDYETYFSVAKNTISKNEKVFFFVVGSGKLEESLKEKVKSLGIQKNVRFTGFVNNPYNYIVNFDLFFMTSLKEGLGSSLLDAFALKTTVVSTNSGGMKELVLHEKTGLISGVKEVALLTEHIQRLITDESLRSKLSANAFEFVQNFSAQTMAAKTHALYQSL
jgi:glycosyltransferase involved in cell wall biosynthesis